MPDRGVVRLTGRVCGELLCLVSIAPLLYTDLSAPILDKVFCCDTSPHAGGIVGASVPPVVAAQC